MILSIRTYGIALAFAATAVALACSDDPAASSGGGTGGKASSGGAQSTAGSGGARATGGGVGSETGGTANTGGANTGGSGNPSAGGATTGGAGGATMTGGAGGAMVGGSGGATGGTGGAVTGGSGGAAAADATAVASIIAVDGSNIAGSATFTQVGNNVTLVIDLTDCPAGPHASHLHENKDCGGTAAADAGGHWEPNGIDLGNYTCASGIGHLEITRTTAMWTIGGDAATDVTTHAIMVHAAGDPNAGEKIACGLFTVAE